MSQRDDRFENFRTADGKVLVLCVCNQDGTYRQLIGGQPDSFTWPLSPGAVTAAVWNPVTIASGYPGTPFVAYDTAAGLIGLRWGMGGPHYLYAHLVARFGPPVWLVVAVDPGVIYTALAPSGDFAMFQSGAVRLVGTAAQAKAYLIAQGAPATNNVIYQPEMVFGPVLPDPLPDPAGYSNTAWGRATLGLSVEPADEWLTWMDQY